MAKLDILETLNQLVKRFQVKRQCRVLTLIAFETWLIMSIKSPYTSTISAFNSTNISRPIMRTSFSSWLFEQSNTNLNAYQYFWPLGGLIIILALPTTSIHDPSNHILHWPILTISLSLPTSHLDSEHDQT